jgi:hypothetical protein
MYTPKSAIRTRRHAGIGPKTLMAVFILLSMVLIASLPTGAVFSKLNVSSVTWSPTKPQPGDNANAFITVTNTGDTEVKIKWIGVHFDWQAPNSYVYQDSASAPITINPSGQYVFILLVVIPLDANFTNHPYMIKINYDSGSSQYSEASDTYYDFTMVKYIPPVTKPIWENPLFIVMVLLIVIAVVLVVVMVIVRQRRIAKEAAKKQLHMRSAVSADTETVDYELARTVTKDHRGPTRVDHKPRPWDTPKNERITGEAPKPPIYRLLGKGQQPSDQPVSQMPQAPPHAQPMAPPQVSSPPPYSGAAPQPMPAKPPPMAPTPQPRGPPPLPVKDQATLHQCPICGKMNKATDTSCPKCGGSL